MGNMIKAKTSKGSGRSGIKRSKGSSHVPNGIAVPMPGMSGPMGVPPQGGGAPAAPQQQPQMPPMGAPGGMPGG